MVSDGGGVCRGVVVEPAKLRGIEAPLSLSHNQTLEGHSGK